MSARLREVLAAHFDPVSGSPYWLRRQRTLDFDVRETIRDVDDLARFGPFDLADLSRCPVTDFVPRTVVAAGGLVLAETGGTTGPPRATAYAPVDFDAAFVTPFLDRVRDAALFDGGHWLWLGPGGPHIIGKAAQRIAALTTGSDAFSVDFDPRWFRRLAAGSLARTRYLDHVLEQALAILVSQDVRYLFCTPVVLAALAPRLAEPLRAAVRFVYLGGMPVTAAACEVLGAAFPAARFLAGYGNTLFGVSHERAPGRRLATQPCDYLPDTTRLVVRVVPLAGGPEAERIAQRAAPGARGQVMMHRLDHSGFLPCVLERDSAERLVLAGDQDGLRDPQPLIATGLRIDTGIY